MRSAVLVGPSGRCELDDGVLLAAVRDALPDHRWVAVPASGGRECLAALREADAVVVAGDHLLDSPGRWPSRSLCLAAALVAGASALGIPTALLGVGAGSLGGPAGRSVARLTVRRADLCVVADDESAAVLAGAGVPTPLRIGADPAWASLGEPVSGQGRGDLVAVVLGAGPPGPAWLVEALRPLAAEGVRVRIQPWPERARRRGAGRAGAPGEVAASAARALGSSASVWPAPATLAEARDALAGAGAVLALRHRAVQVAAMAGVPLVAVAAGPATAGLARRLDQASVPAGAPAAQATSALRSALGAPAPSPGAVKEEMARAAAGFGLLRVVLSRGRTPEAADVQGLSLGPDPWPR